MTAVLILSGAALGGCAASDTRIDPSSPVAGEVAKLTRQPSKFPTFASIPNPPTDIRAPAQYGRSADRIVSAGNALVAATEPSTWTLQNTEAFADQARKDAGPALEPPKAGEAEAFAKEQRERATPPPPRP
jgi:hypothetical protein